ncbi:ArsR family transcriptional regulator [Kocuria sp. JC486]|uniref:arylsulfotransferase family protein n=1 Tax=Kocuria sp. JC486 TaxID=1970736 RepID=UPI00142423D5|nr:arylsulfotransferase family protein [Kocuria sp. JC486]NHU85109.1 ArsR family transcriptional regulator [Kocuria sp. JC486]
MLHIDTPHRRLFRLTMGAVVSASVVLTATACGGSPSESGADQSSTATAAEGASPSETAQQETPESFVSRPDLTPPEVTVDKGEAWSDEHATTDDLTFVTPGFDGNKPTTGAMILDATGEPVWMLASDKEDPNGNYFDLRVQQYQGEPVLTYYLGSSGPGYGAGSFHVLDQNYQEITQVTTGGSLGAGKADFHDSTITDRGTMLLMAYVPTRVDLSKVGGPKDGWAMDGVIQEVDIATGEVLFEWSAMDHVPLTDTEKDFAKAKSEKEKTGTEELPFDYFHINSVREDDDGSLLVSARNTHAVYRLDRETGEVDWTLGGSSSDFEMGDGAEFQWQHDAQRAEDGTLTLFDNHNDTGDGDSSRGLRLELDEEAMTAEVVTEYAPPEDRPAGAMGNMQHLDNGNLLVGWGTRPFFSEYTDDGELVADATHGGNGSYRAYEQQWDGTPATDPDVKLQDEDGQRTAHVSWNGATEVEQWRLVTGSSEQDATAQEPVDRKGFETELPVTDDAQYVAVEALDKDGNVLGTGVAQD